MKPLTALVLDTGILIALFDTGDAFHQTAKVGISQLEQQRTRLFVPAAVVLETSKRLLFDTNANVMHNALDNMLETLEIFDTTKNIIQDAKNFAAGIKKWNGTLEDAMVAQMALLYQIPVWTMNYRDFAAIAKLEFWNP